MLPVIPTKVAPLLLLLVTLPAVVQGDVPKSSKDLPLGYVADIDAAASLCLSAIRKTGSADVAQFTQAGWVEQKIPDAPQAAEHIYRKVGNATTILFFQEAVKDGCFISAKLEDDSQNYDIKIDVIIDSLDGLFKSTHVRNEKDIPREKVAFSSWVLDGRFVDAGVVKAMGAKVFSMSILNFDLSKGY